MGESIAPLVSVCVITYNSSKFVYETLESIRKQTYANIELIISDDCSADDTIVLCEEWVNKNRERFVRCEVIINSQNTGISANCNRAINNSLGQWIKLIAGDDLLMPNCIKDNIEYIQLHSEVLVLQSNTYIIDEHSDIIGQSAAIDELFKLAPADLQYEYCCHQYMCNTTTLFMSKQVYDDMGGYDETIPMMEDTQMWLRLTKRGYKLHFFDAITTQYRKNLNSVSFNKGKDDKIYHSIYKYTVLTNRKYIIPYVTGLLLISNYCKLFILQLFLSCSYLNRKTYLNLFLLKLLSAPGNFINKVSLKILRNKINSILWQEKK